MKLRELERIQHLLPWIAPTLSIVKVDGHTHTHSHTENFIYRHIFIYIERDRERGECERTFSKCIYEFRLAKNLDESQRILLIDEDKSRDFAQKLRKEKWRTIYNPSTCGQTFQKPFRIINRQKKKYKRAAKNPRGSSEDLQGFFFFFFFNEVLQLCLEESRESRGEIEMGAVAEAVLGFIRADADDPFGVALVVNPDVTVGVEHETHLVASKMAVRFAHDDVLAVGLEMAPAAAVGRGPPRYQRRRPDELAADDRYHVLVRLHHLDLVTCLTFDHFVAQHSTA